MLTVALGIFVITWYVSQFSKEAVAAYGIATRIEQVVLIPTMGLNYAVLTLVGQNNGAGRMDRVQASWAKCIRYGLIMMLIGGGLVYVAKHAAMAWFTDDAQVIALGSDYLGIAAITLCAYPILFQTMFLLQGLKRPAFSLWIGLYRQIAAPYVIFHLLAFTLGWQLWGIWWGIFAVTWSASLFTLWWGSRVLRRAVTAQTSDTAP
jgi:Na+-driven multidrug efflux pump